MTVEVRHNLRSFGDRTAGDCGVSDGGATDERDCHAEPRALFHDDVEVGADLLHDLWRQLL